MAYRINRTLIFNPDDGSLKLVDEAHEAPVGELSLTPTASRLLHLLIVHQGSVLQREELLEKVWDDYGLKSSNNSLNQYISTLRRNFADLGMENATIVTVPRIGFMLSQDLEVIATDAVAGEGGFISTVDLLAPARRHEVEASSPLAGTPSVAHKRGVTTSKTVILSLLLLLTIINVALTVYERVAAHRLTFEPHYPIGTLTGCTVSGFYQTSASMNHTLLTLIENKMQQDDLTCIAGGAIYYHAADTFDNNQQQVPFVSVCYPLTDGRYARCRSSYSD